jgi:hypothetical protein
VWLISRAGDLVNERGHVKEEVPGKQGGQKERVNEVVEGVR